jgi:UDP-N-acetylmuramyl pentapeptide phosphotransferase/UDP-N-acetylglucosamine-1-phosphate transferase
LPFFDFNYIDPAISGLTSLLITGVVVMTQKWHGKHSHDTLDGPQKFHADPIPRVGGLAIFLALIVACFISPKPLSSLLCPLVIASLPAFATGLAEDLTKRVSPFYRLLATMVSGVLAWWLTGYSLTHLELTGAYSILVYLPLSIAFTAFAVAGVAHSINMIDGFNGLASGTIMLLFFALGLIAVDAGDIQLAQFCLTMILVTIGFFGFNFPFGKIFLGDGGAYLLGFLLAWVAVMLPIRNPQISVWAPLLVCAYPVNEALLTMGRRFVRKVSIGLPDCKHLHSLIKIKIVDTYFGHVQKKMRNSLVAPFCWLYAALVSAVAVWQYTNTNLLIAAWLISFVLYVFVYIHLRGMVIPETQDRTSEASPGIGVVNSLLRQHVGKKTSRALNYQVDTKVTP